MAWSFSQFIRRFLIGPTTVRCFREETQETAHRRSCQPHAHTLSRTRTQPAAAAPAADGWSNLDARVRCRWFVMGIFRWFVRCIRERTDDRSRERDSEHERARKTDDIGVAPFGRHPKKRNLDKRDSEQIASDQKQRYQNGNGTRQVDLDLRTLGGVNRTEAHLGSDQDRQPLN